MAHVILLCLLCTVREIATVFNCEILLDRLQQRRARWGGGVLTPRNSNILRKLSRIPGSVEHTYVTN
jgi:hypothetical protein